MADKSQVGNFRKTIEQTAKAIKLRPLEEAYVETEVSEAPKVQRVEAAAGKLRAVHGDMEDAGGQQGAGAAGGGEQQPENGGS